MVARRNRTKTAAIIATSALVLALVAGGIAIAITLNQPEEVVATPTSTPEPGQTETPTPTPTPEPAELPASATVHGAIENWDGASGAEVATVAAQFGAAADGEVSAFIDAPVVDEPTTALSSVIEVEPGETYTLTAQARQLTSLPEPVAAAFVIGEERIELPELDANWQEVTGEFTAPDGEGTRLEVVLDDVVVGLGIDDVSITGGSADEVVSNGSFESVDTAQGILNDALILRESSAAIAVASSPGEATWQVLRMDDSVASEGTIELTEAAAAVALDDVPQGYYTFSLTSSSGETVSSPIAVVNYDGATMPVEERLGAATHVDQTWYANSADTLRAMGFGSARNDVLWDQNERSPGVYEFSQHYQTEFDSMRAHGVGLLGIVNYGNPMYDGGNPPSSRSALDAYGAYASAIAERFDVMGLEVFNEFNHDRFNTGACGTAAICYLPLLEAVETHVVGAHDEIPIVAGSTANFPAAWFRDLWSTGALTHADAMSFHPYDPQYYRSPENLTEAVAIANRDMNDTAGDTIPIWITEFGWTTGNELGQARSRDDQAQNLIASQVVSLGEGVERFYWYDLVDDSLDPNQHEGNFGMFFQRSDDVAAHRPKPAAFAQALLINAIAGRESQGRDDAGDGTYSYLFGDAEDAARVVWAPSGERTVSFEAAGPIDVTNLAGSVQTLEPNDGVIEIEVGPRALILQGDFSSSADEPSSAPTEEADEG